jgi:hypothetical protein
LKHEEQEREWDGSKNKRDGKPNVLYLVRARLTAAKPSCTMPLILTGLNLEVTFWYILDENIMKMIA